MIEALLYNILYIVRPTKRFHCYMNASNSNTDNKK